MLFFVRGCQRPRAAHGAPPRAQAATTPPRHHTAPLPALPRCPQPHPPTGALPGTGQALPNPPPAATAPECGPQAHPPPPPPVSPSTGDDRDREPPPCAGGGGGDGRHCRRRASRPLDPTRLALSRLVQPPSDPCSATRRTTVRVQTWMARFASAADNDMYILPQRLCLPMEDRGGSQARRDGRRRPMDG